MFLGFAGQGFKQEAQALLKPGQQATLGHFTIRHDALTVTSDEQKQMITGHVTVTSDGKPVAEMAPAKWFFNKHEQEPTSEVAIRRAAGEDLYIVLAGYDVSTQTATYAITINPLVDWIWFGFGVLALGTGLALMPERAFAFATAKLPADAVTTALVLLLLLVPANARAQTPPAASDGTIKKSELRKQLEADIMCSCGCRAPMNNCPMAPNCHGLRELNPKLDEFLAQGMDREQVRAAFVAWHGGQDILTAPIDKGFNRLAWLFPYLVGGVGATMIVLVARRWSHHDAAMSPSNAAPAAEDAKLRERLDDELRDLD
jgi:cytochrome c-type biogenesis protein CcmH/NrfF